MGLVRRRRPGVHGPAAAKQPASNRKITASGQPVGNQTRMRVAPSTTTDRGPPGSGGLTPYRGSSLAPIRNSSTARAHCRPSRIAQTTSDWPRRMSPQEKIFGVLVL